MNTENEMMKYLSGSGKPEVRFCRKCHAFIGWKNTPKYRELGVKFDTDTGEVTYKGQHMKASDGDFCVDCAKGLKSKEKEADKML